MSRLITAGNIAIFEYERVSENPTFELDKGVLWVGGFKKRIASIFPPLTAMKRYDLKLFGYVIFGEYNEVKDNIDSAIVDILIENHVDTDRCLIMVKKG